MTVFRSLQSSKMSAGTLLSAEQPLNTPERLVNLTGLTKGLFPISSRDVQPSNNEAIDVVTDVQLSDSEPRRRNPVQPRNIPV